MGITLGIVNREQSINNGSFVKKNIKVAILFLALMIISPMNALASFLDGLLPGGNKSSSQEQSKSPPKSTDGIIKELTKKFDIPFGDIKSTVLIEIAKAPFEDSSVVQNLDRLNIAADSLIIGNALLQRLPVSSDATWPQTIVESGPNVSQLLKQFQREGLYDLQRDFLKISPIRIFSANVKNKICLKKHHRCLKNRHGEFRLKKVRAIRGNRHKNIIEAVIGFTKDPAGAKKSFKGYSNAISVYKLENSRYTKFETAYNVKKEAGKKLKKEKKTAYKAMMVKEKIKLKKLKKKANKAEDMIDEWKDKLFDHIESISSNDAIDPSNKAKLKLAKNIYAASTLVAEMDGAAVAVLAVAIAKTPGAVMHLPAEIQQLIVEAAAGLSQSKIAKKRLAILKTSGEKLPESIGEIYAELKPQVSFAWKISSAFADKFNLISVSNMKGGITVVLESEKKEMAKHLKLVKKEIHKSKEAVTINRKSAWVYEKATSKAPKLNIFSRGDTLVVLEKKNAKKGKNFWLRVAKNNGDGGDGWLWSGNGKIHKKAASSGSMFGSLFN